MTRVPSPEPRPPTPSLRGELDAREAARPPAERGVWPVLYPALLDLVRAHRTTLLFVNSRGLCERLARRLNELAGEELVQAHHGSVSTSGAAPSRRG